MAGFLYFFSNVSEPISSSEKIHPKAGVEPHSLRAILAGESLAYAHHPKGPDGSSGTLFAIGRNKQPLRVTPAQTWRLVRSPEQDFNYWVGLDPDFIPTADSLLRSQNLGGEPIHLGSDDWMIPVLHVPFPSVSGLSSVPRRMTYTEEGKFETTPVSEYDEVCKRVAYFQENFDKLDDLSIVRRAFENTVDILSVNYHVGPVEAAMLGLFTDDHRVWFGQVHAEAVGLRAVERLVAKKNASSGSEENS